MNQSTKFNIDYLITIIDNIASKYQITEKEAEIIIRSQFDFIKYEMSKFDEFNTIKLKHLGKWKANPYRVNAYRSKKRMYEESNTNNGRVLEPRPKEPRDQKI